MRAGELHKRLTIQARSTAQDALGGQLQTWANVATVYASIEPLNGRELLASQAVQSEVTHTITMRYQPGLVLTSANRGVLGSRIFNFGAVLNVNERNRELRIQATELLNNG